MVEGVGMHEQWHVTPLNIQMLMQITCNYTNVCVCVCQPALLWVAVCCSCIMFLGPLPGTFCFLDFVYVCCRTSSQKVPNLLEIIGNAPGSRPGAPWGAIGVKNASRLKENIKSDFIALSFETVLETKSVGIWTDGFGLFFGGRLQSGILLRSSWFRMCFVDICCGCCVWTVISVTHLM